jgi:SRSO17 transposase
MYANTSRGPAGLGAGADHVSEYCQHVFGSLARSDQRRWAEVYVRGLLDTPGRKSLKGMSAHVLGRPTIQALQQFVNQSPWDCAAVRRDLAGAVNTALAPRAWSVDEVVFRKNGNQSAGVAPQFVPTRGRVVNCQVGLAVSLVRPEASAPANWRLQLPRVWDDDPPRRAAAHIPDEVRHRPRWALVLDAVDELVGDWELTPAPVLVDSRYDTDVRQLLHGLEARGLGYIVEIGEHTALPVPRMRSTTRPVTVGPPQPGHTVTPGDLALGAVNTAARATVSWTEGVESRSRYSQFLVVQLPAAIPAPYQGAQAVMHRPRRPRRLIAEWPLGKPKPRGYWVTNLSSRLLPDLVALAKLGWRPRHDLHRMAEEFGLGDFEGRSFQGWHHHVTLVGAAYAHHCLERLAELEQDPRRHELAAIGA